MTAVKNILFFPLLFLATLLLTAVQKVVFVAVHIPDATALEFLAVVWNGWKLDISVAGYICALPLLLSIVSAWLPYGWWRKVVAGIIYLFAAISAVIFAGNLGLYEYWGFPVDNSVMQFLATPKQAAASVEWVQGLTTTAVALLYFGAEWLCYSRILRLYNPEKGAKALRRIAITGALILLVGLDLLAIRGGVSTAVANLSKVYFSDRMVLNHAAVNPTFSLLATLGEKSNSAEYQFFDEEERQSIINTLSAVVDGPSESLLAVKRPDIVLIIAESFGCSTIFEKVGNEVVAPRFAALAEEGIYFENCYASSFRTDRGVLAALSGFHAQTRSSLMKQPEKSRHLASIARSLGREGYFSTFVHGGDLNFTDMSSYLYGTGYNRLVGLKDLHFDAPTAKWGYADEIMAEEFLRQHAKAKAEGKPRFSTWLTLSSHEPFDVIENHFEDKMLNSMHFADKQIAHVVEQLRASEGWNNTLVIIIADHAYAYPYGIANSAAERHHIPMLWLGGALKGLPRRVSTFCSQTDLPTTLLSQMGIAHDDFPFSNNIFDRNSEALCRGYYIFNNGFGIVDEGGTTIYDCTLQKAISDGADEEDIARGKALLQTTYKIIDEL